MDATNATTVDHTVDRLSNVNGDPSRPTILLYPTGVYFEPFDPNPEHLDIRCIAHGLAGTNRYNGQTKSLVNTADHSVIVSLRAEVPRRPTARGTTALRRLEMLLSALMHDAPEAVSGFGDVTGPVKNHPSFKALLVAHEDRIADAVAVRHNLPKNFQHDPVVKAADAWSFHWENRDLRGIDPPDGIVLPKEELQPLSHDQARNAFLFRYMDLTGEPVDVPEDWTPGGLDNHLASWRSYLTTMRAVVDPSGSRATCVKGTAAASSSRANPSSSERSPSVGPGSTTMLCPPVRSLGPPVGRSIGKRGLGDVT